MDNSNEISRLNNHINLLEKHIHILEDKIVKSEARNDNVQLLFESLLHRVQELEEQHAISFNDDHETQSFPIYHSKHKHSSSVDNNTDNSSDKSVRNDTVLSSTESINITSNDMCSIERSEWKYLDKNLVTKASAINSTVDSLIAGLSPSKFSECYRQSVRAYILKQIQDVPPGVKVFFQGLYVLDCYLPNDPIRLSLFFWPGHVYKVNWYLSLNEILTASSEDGPDEPPSEKVIDENSDCFMDHTITNLTYSQKSKSLIMQVDEFVDMEIKADNCEEFILLSLVEEFSMLIGKPKLLKDSIILIRAWWFYESKAFLQHKDIKDLLLSDYSLLVMTCAILNERNHEINTPFEVLCYFVGIYSNFDYETHFITINGIKPFCAINSLSTSPSVYHLPTPGLVLTNEVIMKYWNLHKENMNGEELVKEEASTSYIEIERASLNILHPLKNANKTLAYNKRKGNFIFSCFANGASKMHEALLEASKGNLSLIENLMNKIFLLFHNKYVPAAFEKCSSVPSPIRIRDRPILDELLKQIDFCNLILYRHLTSNGLVFLIKDIITERGPLPIGEIGKTLNMTSLIKDKFGGLKKFLETYQDMFIICSNHAYNPHVFVRSDVDSVQIPTIEKGNSNDIMQTMLQSSKIKIPAGKKKNLKKDDVPTMNQIPSTNPLSDQFIQDSRAKANSDNYFYNNDTSVNANNSNNMFAGGNYGSYGFMGSNTTSIDEFSQNTYTQSNSLLRSMEGENSDLMKSSYLFNNLAPRGNDLRNNFLDGNNFRDGRPPGLMPMDDKSRWDIYRSPAGKSDTDNLSSLDMNFFNNNFNADLSHLMSGTSLSSSTTATNSSVNVSKNNSNNSINLSRNNSNSIIASRNNSNSIIANGNTNSSSINIHRIDSNNTIISSRNNSNNIIASRNNSNNGINNSIGLNNNDINNNNSLNNGASFNNFRY